MNSFNGTAEITDEGVKKHFKKFESSDAIFELVWNGLDANASSVNIRTIFNDLDGLESIEVQDNGDGIDIENLQSSFEKFNESSKVNNEDKHGSHGKGRLAFHIMCASASWYTKRPSYNAQIDVRAEAIRDYQGSYLEEKKQHASLSSLESGTCVCLQDFSKNKVPSDEDLIKN